MDSLLKWHLAVFLLTWPGVEGIVFTGPSFLYNDAQGLERVTSMTATMALRGRALVYATLSNDDESSSLALKVQRAHAERLGAQLQVFSAERLYSNAVEVSNRRAAHLFLFQARELKQQANSWEAGFRLMVREQPRSLGEVAKDTGMTWEQACVGFLKCWMNERVLWHIGRDSLSPRLIVESVES